MNKNELSALDYVNRVRAMAPEPVGVTVLLLAVKVRGETDVNEALSAHRKIVEDVVDSENCNITGILVGQSTSVLHLLEGPCMSVLRILKALSEHPHFGYNSNSNASSGSSSGAPHQPQAPSASSSPVKAPSNAAPAPATSSSSIVQWARVICNMEDVPQRMYPEWYSCIVPERKSPIDEVLPESANDVASDVLAAMGQVGRGLSSEAQGEVELGKYAAQFPGKNLVIALSQCHEFFTLKEYVEAYVNPYHLQLESEGCYPMEAIVKY